MRLPWPFGRAQRSASAAGGEPGIGTPRPDGGTSGMPGAPLPGAAPGVASPGAWRDLPPLAETLGPPPLVAPNRPFATSLASSEPPAPILAPLAHGRSLEAPKGLVSGIARPTTAASALPVPAPVQRSPLARRAASQTFESVLEPGGFDADAGPSAAGTSDARTSEGPATGPANDPVSAPIRRLEPVIGSSATATGGRALTLAPEPARAPLVGLVGQPLAAGAPRKPLAIPGGPPSVQRAPAAVAPAPTPATPAAAAAPPAPIAAAPRLTIGQARRLGLGAPVSGGPVSAGAVTGRDARPPAPPSSSVDPGTQRAPARAALDLPNMPLATPSTPAAAENHADSSSATPAPGAQAAPAGASPATPPPVAPTAVQRSPLTAAVPAHGRVPIVSAEPLRTRIQRAPLTLPQRGAEGSTPSKVPSTSTATATAGAPSGPVTIHRDSKASQLSTALDARSFTHGGEIFLPASHGPLSSGTGKALLAHELTHVAQQRRLGSSLPGEESPHGKALEAEAAAAERAPDMVLATGRERESVPSPEAPSPPAPLAPEVRTPSPQRAPEGGGQLRLEVGPIVLHSDGDQGKSAGTSRRRTSHTHTEQELEVLAHQLYHRIGRHLRRELLVDRERIGFALDLP